MPAVPFIAVCVSGSTADSENARQRHPGRRECLDTLDTEPVGEVHVTQFRDPQKDQNNDGWPLDQLYYGGFVLFVALLLMLVAVAKWSTAPDPFRIGFVFIAVCGLFLLLSGRHDDWLGTWYCYYPRAKPSVYPLEEQPRNGIGIAYLHGGFFRKLLGARPYLLGETSWGIIRVRPGAKKGDGRAKYLANLRVWITDNAHIGSIIGPLSSDEAVEIAETYTDLDDYRHQISRLEDALEDSMEHHAAITVSRASPLAKRISERALLGGRLLFSDIVAECRERAKEHLRIILRRLDEEQGAKKPDPAVQTSGAEQ